MRLSPVMLRTLRSIIENKMIGARSLRGWRRRETLDALERRELIIIRPDGYIVPTRNGCAVIEEKQ